MDGAKLALVAVLITAVAMIVQNTVLLREDKAIGETIMKHFDFDHERSSRLEARVEALEKQNADLVQKIGSMPASTDPQM